MRRIVLPLVFAVLFSTSVSAQAPQPTQQSPTMPAASKDPQAVSVLNQALNVLGGAAAIKAVTDYTATGNITYHMGPGNDVQGSVTVIGGPTGQVRMDSNLLSGTRSWVVDNGPVTTKAEDGTVWKTPTGPVPSSDAFPYRAPRFPNSLAFPLRQLVTVLNSSAFNLTYKGLVQLDGRSVHDVQAQPVMPAQVDPRNPIVASRALDFFIDASSFELAMAQDLAAKGTLHQLRYSDYKSAGGVLAPFAISEQMGGQATWTIQLSQITFNTGVQDSAFAIQ